MSFSVPNTLKRNLVSGLLLCFIVFLLPIKTNASSLPSYSTTDNGDIVVDGEFSEDGEKTTYDEPVSVEEFQEIEGEDDARIDDCGLPDKNIEEVLLPGSEDLENVQTAPSEVSLSDVAPIAVYPSDFHIVSSAFKPENCLIYDITYNGTACTLLIPASYYESVYIDDNGVIWNVGVDNIKGRIIFSDTVDDSEYDMYLVQILSCISSLSAPSQAYANRSLTEVRHYYLESSDRIRYESYYGAITTIRDNSNLSRNSVAVNKLMFSILIALLLGGGFLCYRRH